MICGERDPAPLSRGDQRKRLLAERDERIVTFMRQQRSIAVIAELEGLEPEYCRKACRRLAVDHDIDYKPTSESSPAGLTDASRRFRSGMGDMLYRYREVPGRHQLEVSRETGLTQAQQVRATQRPNDHDWTLGQLERFAGASGQDFTHMMLRALLPPDQYQKVARCLST